MLQRLLLYLRTACYLKPSQIFHYAIRRVLPARPVRPSASYIVRKSREGESPCVIRGVYVDHSSFRFLNTVADLGTMDATIDWPASTQSRLWQYNLHYFDYLREHDRPVSNKNHLIQGWIEDNHQGSRPGWEPFTTSLRIVNWIFYFRKLPLDDIPGTWIESLHLQALWLERNDEKHILANHYFENLKALFFAGCFFEGSDAERWLKRATKEIPEQIQEQTLDDGGHYERSHQYHCLMLENYLDIYNISRSYLDICPNHLVEAVKSSAERSLNWLSASLFPDGSIPLFNDSAFGISIPPGELVAYAERLSIATDHCSPDQPHSIDLPATGLYGCRAGSDMVIIDCGEIGPSYQPGHTHCDFLSYELMLDRQRIVVDTGVFDYAPGPMRDYVRSTKAHNTVSVDGGEQSEIWGEFRVARRARKILSKIHSRNSTIEFSGAYEGFYGTKGRIIHRREVTIAVDKRNNRVRGLTIIDRLTGSGRHTVESFIHFHPTISLEVSIVGEIKIIRNRMEIGSIIIPDDQEYQIDAAVYCPEFGLRQPNQVVALREHSDLPLTLQYEIRRSRC